MRSQGCPQRMMHVEVHSGLGTRERSLWLNMCRIVTWGKDQAHMYVWMSAGITGTPHLHQDTQSPTEVHECHSWVPGARWQDPRGQAEVSRLDVTVHKPTGVQVLKRAEHACCHCLEKLAIVEKGVGANLLVQ